MHYEKRGVTSVYNGHDIYSIVVHVTWQSNLPISQLIGLCNVFMSVWSMFPYKTCYLWLYNQCSVIPTSYVLLKVYTWPCYYVLVSLHLSIHYKLLHIGVNTYWLSYSSQSMMLFIWSSSMILYKCMWNLNYSIC